MDGTAKRVHRQLFLKCFWALLRFPCHIHVCFSCRALRAQRCQASNIDIWCCPLRSVIAPASQDILMMKYPKSFLYPWHYWPAAYLTDLCAKCSSGWCVPFIKFTMRKYFKHLIYLVCSIIAFFLYWHFIQCANSFGTGFADFVKNINFMINIHVSSVTSVSVSQIKFQHLLSVSQSTSTLLENVAEGRTVDTDAHGE